jgi:hypothetical protein
MLNVKYLGTEGMSLKVYAAVPLNTVQLFKMVTKALIIL